MASDETESVVTVTGDQRRVSEAERQHLARQGRNADRQALFGRIRWGIRPGGTPSGKVWVLRLRLMVNVVCVETATSIRWRSAA